MAIVTGTLDRPLEEARTAVRSAAAGLGYALAEGQGAPGVFVFKKGATLFSWGSGLEVELEAASDTSTRVTIMTKETFALTDWGRGKRAAQRLLGALGAG